MKKKAPALRSIKKKKRTGHSGKRSDQNQSQTIADAIATLANTVAAERDADRKEQQRSERGKSFREWLTIILLFATGGFVLGQLREMQRAYRPIAEQAEFTRESYAAVQRAFVSDVRLEMVPNRPNGLPEYWEPEITIANSGGTPTRELRYVTREIPPSGFPITDPELWLDDDPGDSTIFDGAYVARGRVTVGPKGTAKLAVPRFVYERPAQQEVPLTRSEGVIYGAISYLDQFSSSARHITKFCFYINVSPRGETFTPPCDFWNCSDDDCEIDKKRYEAAGGK